MTMDEKAEAIQHLVQSAHRYHRAVDSMLRFMEDQRAQGFERVQLFKQHAARVEHARQELLAVTLMVADAVTAQNPYRPDERQLDLLPTAKA